MPCQTQVPFLYRSNLSTMAEEDDFTKHENNTPPTVTTTDASKHHEEPVDTSSDANDIVATTTPVPSDELDPRILNGEKDPPSEQPTVLARVDYTVLTPTQKKIIVFTASLASVFSPMATAIYCKFKTQSMPMSNVDNYRSFIRNNCKRPQCVEYTNQYYRDSLSRCSRNSSRFCCRLGRYNWEKTKYAKVSSFSGLVHLVVESKDNKYTNSL